MNLEEINRKHLIHQDMLYRIGYGLASRLLKYENGIIHLELEIRKKWNRTIESAVNEIAYCWRDTHSELKKAVACKVYIIDCKKFPYKRTLIHLGILPRYDAKRGLFFEGMKSKKGS